MQHHVVGEKTLGHDFIAMLYLQMAPSLKLLQWHTMISGTDSTEVNVGIAPC